MVPASPAVVKGHRLIRLMVRDERGAPVAQARLTIEMTVKSQPLTVITESRADGAAEFHLDEKSLQGKETLLVKAEANRLTSSRFIPLARER